MSSVPEARVGWLEETIGTKESSAGIGGGVTMTDTGCPFFNRCPLAIPGTCNVTSPPKRMPSEKHVIECHREISELT